MGVPNPPTLFWYCPWYIDQSRVAVPNEESSGLSRDSVEDLVLSIALDPKSLRSRVCCCSRGAKDGLQADMSKMMSLMSIGGVKCAGGC